MIWIELIILLACIVPGARLGGIGLGAVLGIAGLIMLVFKASPEAALKGTIMRSGITAIICILGISWLALLSKLLD